MSAIWRAIEAEYPGIWILKSHGGPYQRAGIPDLLLCWEGMFIGMEVKHQKPGESEQAARERTTPLQRNEIRRINAAGGMAATVISVEGALELIEKAQQKRQREYKHGT